MAIERTINVGGLDVRMRASALIPRLYRAQFGRDMIRDMNDLREHFKEAAADEEKQLSVMDLTVFENIAWVMAYHADSSIPSDPDEWLDSIPGVFSVYEALPEILKLWSENMATTAVPRKK